jgi:adenosylhomocysteine nucleosidase
MLSRLSLESRVMLFRMFLQNWLRNAAREKIREKVMETARQQCAAGQGGSAEAGQAAAVERGPFHVAVVLAFGEEAGALEDLVEGSLSVRGEGFVATLGGLRGRSAVVVRSGAGTEAARRATRAVLAGHQPGWVISAGFAAGLDPRLRRYDILMANELVAADGRRLSLELKVDPADLARTPHVHVGCLLTADETIRTPEEKRSLAARHQAMAVDTESYAIAEVCREAKARFLAVRAITDPVDETLPSDVQRLVDQKTRTAQLGAAVGALWRRPASFKDMYRLKEHGLIASDRLAKFLVSTIEQLVPK